MPFLAPAPFIPRYSFGILLVATLVFSGPAWSGDEKRIYSDEELATMQPPGPNPYLSFLPDGAEVDWNYWQQKSAFETRKEAARRPRAGGPNGDAKTVGTVAEVEPNDSLATPQVLGQFGTGPGQDPELDITGEFSELAKPTSFMPAGEDDGSIPTATPTGGVSGELKTATGTIGDGPHGSAGSGSGDFDFFSVSGVQAGDLISLRVVTPDPTGDLDPNCAIWSSSGDRLGFKEDLSNTDFDCALFTVAPAAGTYYFSVGGWREGGPSAAVPIDPFDSSSGQGAGSEGAYEVTVGINADDTDCFAFPLRPGDVFAAGGTDGLAGMVLVGTTGEVNMSINHNPTYLFPDSSPLRASSNVVADLVAHEKGFHGLCVVGAPGPYEVSLGAHRPSLEDSAHHQILFVDFDGADFDPAVFGGPPGQVHLSPLVDFLPGWGLSAEDENAVIDSILSFLNRSITESLALRGNPAFSVEIRNSRDHGDPWGSPNVSRLIVGGTRDQLGLGDLLGRAQSIDPGNFDTQETGVTLLDILSAPASQPSSLNQIALAGGVDIIDLIGVAVGSITAHEAGHFLGNWHTEQFHAASPPNIMDQGGHLNNNIGIGPDLIFGTEDDVVLDFVTDFLVQNEGYSGIVHTGPRTAFALSGAPTSVFADGFESGDTSAWTSAP